jgi:hypothetical protein
MCVACAYLGDCPLEQAGAPSKDGTKSTTADPSTQIRHNPANGLGGQGSQASSVDRIHIVDATVQRPFASMILDRLSMGGTSYDSKSVRMTHPCDPTIEITGS